VKPKPLESTVERTVQVLILSLIFLLNVLYHLIADIGFLVSAKNTRPQFWDDCMFESRLQSQLVHVLVLGETRSRDHLRQTSLKEKEG
jgi:hypothetical protein